MRRRLLGPLPLRLRGHPSPLPSSAEDSNDFLAVCIEAEAAKLHYLLGEHERAVEGERAMVEYLERRISDGVASPGDMDNLSTATHQLALSVIALDASRVDEAMALVDRSDELHFDLMQEPNYDYAARIGFAANAFARTSILRTAGRMEAALEAVDEAVGLWSELTEGDPTNNGLRGRLCATLFERAVCLQAMERWDAAADAFAEVSLRLEEMPGADGPFPRMRREAVERRHACLERRNGAGE